ncbi:MAG: SGNH/GDSL hydrolase family protein [Sediminibacterium sp.]
MQFLYQLTATGCTKKNDLAMVTQGSSLAPKTDSTRRRFLALGDSYTIGQSVLPNERFPAQAADLLHNQGIAMDPPQYIATTGWTTGDLLQAIASANVTGTYDVVTLLIGVNDQYQGVDTAVYRMRFTQLLQRAIVFSGNKPSHVFVLSIPDYGVTPFGGGSKKISREIDAFNAINKQVTLSYHITYADITPISREPDPGLIAGDGLHPSAKQYGKWVQLLVPLLVQALK